MNFLRVVTSFSFLLSYTLVFAQSKEQRKFYPKRITASIKIDGVLDEEAWKVAPVANNFIIRRPVRRADNSYVGKV